MNITEHKDFRRYKKPVFFDGYMAIGYFPYERARVRVPWDGVRPSRELFAHVENAIQHSPNAWMDNKCVILFEDLTGCGTTDFAIFFHDLSCVINTWDEVYAYNGKELTNE